MSDSRLATSTSPEVTTKAWCNTRVRKIKIDYQWTIENYNFVYKSCKKFYESSIFFDEDDDKVKWNLRFAPTSAVLSNTNALHLHLNPSIGLEVQAEYKFSILNSKGEETNVFKGEQKFGGNVEYGGAPTFIKQDLLLSEDSGLLPENKLTILCEVSYVSDINTSGQSGSLQIKLAEYKLSEDFCDLLKDPKLSDVTLVVGDHEIKAHKAILAARSDVFAAMFEHDFEENKLNRVVITDVAHEVLKEMLYFIYTDNAPNLDEMDYELFEAADKYAMEKLKAMCEKALCANLSIDVAMKTLTLANRHSAELLKARTKHFIRTHISEIMDTESWENVTNN